MRTVHKAEIRFENGARMEAAIPATAKVVHVGQQDCNSVCIWYELDTSHAVAQPRVFVVHGTGHPIADDGRKHVGSCVDNVNGLVWHVYEEAT